MSSNRAKNLANPCFPNRACASAITGLILVLAGFAPGTINANCAPTDEHDDSNEWVELFDGKSLEGWTRRNGTAVYEVVEGTIRGTTNEGSPNSFLCTEQNYGDFELTFEVKVHNRLNSGVQIRSRSKGNKDGGRVFGPQVEIEASGKNGAEAGYVYGEATGRGWLTPKDKLKAHKIFKDNEWNHYRIRAQGPRIQTWINDQQVSDLVDEPIFKTHPTGFIGLQVHSIGKGQGPFSVQWRNLKLRLLAETSQ